MKDRQRQFLGAFVRLYKRTGKPVHYSDVAKLMGVSPFTAYDAMLELSRKGFVKKDFELGLGKGRARVNFQPATGFEFDSPITGESSLIKCISSINFFIVLAAVKVPDILVNLMPKKRGDEWVSDFTMKLFYRLCEHVEHFENQSDDLLKKLNKAIKQFRRSLPKLSKIEIATLTASVTTLLALAQGI